MEGELPNVEGVLILADESARWIIAGLSQVERLSLALNEYLGRTRGPHQTLVCFCWLKDNRAVLGLERLRRVPHLFVIEDVDSFWTEMAAGPGNVVVLNTRLVVERGGFDELLLGDTVDLPVLCAPAADFYPETRSPSALLAQTATDRVGQKWSYLHDTSQVGRAERQLLLSTGKSQDGVIARYLNRPLSRAVSRLLLRFPISPNQWSILAMVIPIAGAFFLMRGDRWGFIFGAILFQLQSALDGCDGEIARLKYLESSAGAILDGVCDRLATMLLAIGLGIGLSRHVGIDTLHWPYLWEGIVSALLIGVGETLLQRTTIEEELQRAQAAQSAYPDYVRSHQQYFNVGDQLKIWAIKHTGMLRFGAGVTSFFVQATKRDVFNFAFALFILCGWPELVLHILAIVAVAIALMALRELPSFARELRATRSRPV